MKIVKIIQLKIVIFTAVYYCCILHGRVCVMLRCKQRKLMELVNAFLKARMFAYGGRPM